MTEEILSSSLNKENLATDFPSFFQETSHHARQHACALCGNIDDAEDIVQEAYTRMYRYIASSREGNEILNPRMYLYTIIRNLAIDNKRYQLRVITREIPTSIADLDSEEVPLYTQASDLMTPEDLAIEAESRNVLLYAISRLPKAAQEVATLHFIHALSIREIAQCLNISINTAKSVLHRSKISIRNTVVHNL
jgi:RNA polymerase sigma-70 factor, ECF subfamily